VRSGPYQTTRGPRVSSSMQRPTSGGAHVERDVNTAPTLPSASVSSTDLATVNPDTVLANDVK
jgi:hypothetical protein